MIDFFLHHNSWPWETTVEIVFHHGRGRLCLDMVIWVSTKFYGQKETQDGAGWLFLRRERKTLDGWSLISYKLVSIHKKTEKSFGV
jgi:hypothetical protein